MSGIDFPKKQIAILGSTGSIGTQTLDIISQYPEKFELELLTAHHNSSLLIEQARKYLPATVITTVPENYSLISDALKDLPIKVFAGIESVNDVITGNNVDVIVAAMVGFSGLIPVIEGIKAGKTIALANKETLVVAGEIIKKLSLEYHSPIIPIDSEHSAIFQCLTGEGNNPIEKILLTASGGPFLGFTKEQLQKVKPCDALKHPTWCMGNKVTIDSASLMNKGLEMIEAHWLFNVDPKNIQVVVHPQSIIHSMVSFTDGSVKAQLSIPDMRMPILYALSYPHRFETSLPRFNPFTLNQLTFQEPDMELFPNLAIAYQAIEKGGNIPCIMNAANEIAVDAFLNNRILFTQIPELIQKVIENTTFVKNITIDNLIETDSLAREVAKRFLNEPMIWKF